MLSQNGFEQTTIANIARETGVADSLVYQYFKNKQDLLFSVAEERFSDAQALLEEQLQGIRDPASCLGKMFWFGLRYNDLHPGYLRILLFECRSNKDFYSSAAYAQMRKHAALATGILNDGVGSGVFRPDLDVRLMRDVVYGTLDAEAIATMAFREISEGIADFDDIMALIMPMIRRRELLVENGKEGRIMAAAEEAFARKGFAKATIAEIARGAQVAEWTIYEYFQNKEDLLFSTARKRFQQHQAGLGEIFEVRTPLRRLLRYHCRGGEREKNRLPA
ncbi:MAG: TetR family transcriptional regulator [Deltaproteobacteria bacterium]|nr:TetR family transcriptional regulator [Candidatus Anaeroferrophillacea bacterium]